jgi:hypothetical protein
MQFKVNRPKWAKEIVQPYTAIFTHIHSGNISTQQMNQLQCKIGEIAQEIVRGILTGTNATQNRNLTQNGTRRVNM